MQQFRFGEQTEFTLVLNSLQSYSPGNPPISHPPIPKPPDFRFDGRNSEGMAASPVYEECTEISTESEFSVEDDIYEERSNSDFAVQAHHGWPNYLTSASKKRPSAKCREYHCRRIKGIWSADSIDSFAEKVLSDLRIPEVTPMGL